MCPFILHGWWLIFHCWWEWSYSLSNCQVKAIRSHEILSFICLQEFFHYLTQRIHQYKLWSQLITIEVWDYQQQKDIKEPYKRFYALASTPFFSIAFLKSLKRETPLVSIALTADSVKIMCVIFCKLHLTLFNRLEQKMKNCCFPILCISGLL